MSLMIAACARRPVAAVVVCVYLSVQGTHRRPWMIMVHVVAQLVEQRIVAGRVERPRRAGENFQIDVCAERFNQRLGIIRDPAAHRRQRGEKSYGNAPVLGLEPHDCYR